MIEAAKVPQPPPIKDYEVDTKGSVNGRIVDRYLRYRFRLIGVENGVVSQINRMFKDAFDAIDIIFNEKNPELLKLLSQARLVPSSLLIKEAADVAIPLNSQSIEEAKKGARSPLAPAAIKELADLLVSFIRERLNGVVNRISDMISQTAIELAVTEPQIAAAVINNALPKAVIDKLIGGVLVTGEIPIDRIGMIASRPLGGRTHAQALKVRYGDSIERVRGVLAAGLIQGKGIKPLAREVRGFLNKNLAARAGMIARTELQRVAVDANKELYKANTDVLKAEVWISTLDLRLCLQCLKLDGMRFNIGEGPYPVESTHPNCRCLRAPVTKSWRELGIDMDEAPIGARASMNGLVPGKITAVDWFAKQPQSFQKEILGGKRYEYYREGKLKLEQFASNRKIYTLAQLRKMYGIKDDTE